MSEPIFPISHSESVPEAQKFGPISLELIATSLQGIYTVVFLVPSVLLLSYKWQHLDIYSKAILFIYQVSMVFKLTFYLTEYFI
jgi:hypothetical protein